MANFCNYYYMNNDMFNRTERDLKEMSHSCSNIQNTNYGPNPVRDDSEKQITSIGSYKSLGVAYNPDIKNDCVIRWYNDQFSNDKLILGSEEHWYMRTHKTGKGLK
jgi:hypothetical protein